MYLAVLEIWLSNGAYLNLAIEFIIKLRFRLEVFHDCILNPGVGSSRPPKGFSSITFEQNILET